MEKKATHSSVIALYNSIGGGGLHASSAATPNDPNAQPERITRHVHNGDKTHELAEDSRNKTAAKVDPGELNQMSQPKITSAGEPSGDIPPKKIPTPTKTQPQKRVEQDRMAARQQVPAAASMLPKTAVLKLKLKLAGCATKKYAELQGVPTSAVKIASALAVLTKEHSK